MGSIMNKVRRIINSLRFESTTAHEDLRMLIGEGVLASKMGMWDTKEIPFIPKYWNDYGFSVFSQNDEDGLLQYIIHHTDIKSKKFIEFGVENYAECNTKFLLLHDCWSGLIMDGSDEYMEHLRHTHLNWRRRIDIRSAFITKENINDIINDSEFTGDIGLLSVDIDGNDYWVLEAINSCDPSIVVCEYNPIFGNKEKVTIPYDPKFYRTEAHYSNLYYGVSLNALVYLMKSRGYKLVCVNNIGNNAFFVKADCSDLSEVSIDNAWRENYVRESIDEAGNLTYLDYTGSGGARELISEQCVIDVTNGEKKFVKDLKF